MKASLYVMVASNGRRIGKATQVTLPDGRVIRFMGRMSNREAIRQTKLLLERESR